MSSSTAQQIVSEIEKQVEGIQREIARYPWHDRHAFGNFLAQTFYYVRRVSQVLAAAIARTSVDDTALHDHFVHAIIEEKDHGVLAINDLREFNFTIDQFPEHPLTRAYYQTLFYMIDSVGPASVIGYFIVVEAWAALRGRFMYDAVASAHGGKGLAFTREHVLLDVAHYAHGVEFLKNLPAGHQHAVLESVRLSGPIYRHMVAALCNEESARLSS